MNAIILSLLAVLLLAAPAAARHGEEHIQAPRGDASARAPHAS
jgi:hypothetical protein